MNWQVLAQWDPEKDIVRHILEVRGLEEKEIEEFINPPPVLKFIKDFDLEFKKSLKAARDLIKKAISENKTIVIHGDYDADGICATAILYLAITKELNYENVVPFIPNRFDHGYGLSEASINSILESLNESEPLFITVDSGITAVEEVKFLKNLNIPVIITDHHQKPPKLPEADVILWNDSMVGSSISWLLAKALGANDKYLESLASIATVTDIGEIKGFNRSLLKIGLDNLNKNTPSQISALIEISEKKVKEISAYDLGWLIGPRINASGRLQDGIEAFNLLVEHDFNKIKSFAKNLEQINRNRQNLTIKLLEESSLDASKDLPPIIIQASEDYHEGIIGLVAGRLTQTHYRPSVIISLENGVGKASVRSIPGFDVISFLRKFEDMFINVGGHPMAAGFSIKESKIQELSNLMLEEATSYVKPEVFEPFTTIDLELPLDQVSLELHDSLELLKPFGPGNNKPKFTSVGVGVVSTNVVGRDKNHLSMNLYKDGKYYKAIYFGGAEYAEKLGTGEVIDIAYTLNKNEFNNQVNIDLNIVDIKLNT